MIDWIPDWFLVLALIVGWSVMCGTIGAGIQQLIDRQQSKGDSAL